MLSYFKELVRQEKPDYILGLKVSTVDQLNVVSCRWRRNRSYSVAYSYFTDTWISKEVLGPLHPSFSSDLTNLSLYDIAVINNFDSFRACQSFSAPTECELKACLDSIKAGLDEQVTRVLGHNEFGDHVSFKLLLAPYPSIVLKVTSDNGLLGTILVTGDGTVMPCFVCDKRLYIYVEELKAGSIFSPSVKMLTGGSNL